MSDIENPIVKSMRIHNELIRKTIKPTQSQLREIHQQNISLAREFTKQWEISTKLINPITSSIGQKLVATTSQLRNILITHIDFTQIAKHWDNIRHGILETEEDIKVFKAAMVDMGYPPHDGMDIRQMRMIAKRYIKDSGEVEENIDKIMSRLYSPEKMRDILCNWEKSKIIYKRLPLLRNAIMAHNIGMYDLVVPSVLSQLEGLLVDIFNVKGRVTGEIQGVILNNLLLKNLDFESSFSFDVEIHKYYSENILVNFEHGKTSKSDLSRHAILHGSHTGFGKQTTSMKVLLLFDYLVTASKDIEAEDIAITSREVTRIRKRRRDKRR